MRIRNGFLLLLLTLFPAIAPCADTSAPPIPVKVVVVAMFELGADTGDAPGEYQSWVER
jgi:purine nucleoside permease